MSNKIGILCALNSVMCGQAARGMSDSYAERYSSGQGSVVWAKTAHAKIVYERKGFRMSLLNFAFFHSTSNRQKVKRYSSYGVALWRCCQSVSIPLPTLIYEGQAQAGSWEADPVLHQ